MSGFIAIVNIDGAPVDQELLQRLTESLHFRGPDLQQTWIDGNVGLGHTLFRTTHEALYENQPASLDSKVYIAGSIRIDGREELVDKLGLTGALDLNHTPDSELILHTYSTKSENFLDHLLGDFAFVLWDGKKRKLLCVKDRFGKRQLYYCRIHQSFIVSNSIHCLLQYPGISKQLSEQAIGDFLLFGDHTWGNKAQTAFTAIQSLLPSHALTLQDGQVKTWSYWNFPLNLPLLRYKKENDYLVHFQDIFQTAVSDRLRTDKAAVSLSGGIDSSAIAATIRGIGGAGDQTFELTALTVLHDSIHPSDEHYYADLTATRLGLTPHYMDGGSYPLLSRPVLTTRPLEEYQPDLGLDFYRACSELSRIMLTGAAGDNLLTFSSVLPALKERNPLAVLFDIYHLRKLYGTYPGFGTGLLARMKWLRERKRNGDNSHVAPYPYPGWINPEFESRLKLKERWHEIWSWKLPHAHPRHPRIHEALVQPDWNTDDIYMHCNFTLPEERDPFLDQRLVEFVLSLPPLPWLYKKHLLRKSMAEKLPAELIKRPKTPLGLLHDSLLKQPGTGWVDSWLPVPELSPFIDRTKIPQLSTGDCEENLSYTSLRPLLLNIWLRELK